MKGGWLPLIPRGNVDSYNFLLAREVVPQQPQDWKLHVNVSVFLVSGGVHIGSTSLGVPSCRRLKVGSPEVCIAKRNTTPGAPG